MGRTDRLPNLIVDVVGGCTAAVFVLVFLWLTLFRSDGTALQVRELTRVAQTAQRDLSRFKATRDRLHTALADAQAELAKTGRLPDQAPVEEYFQGLSRLAAHHRLRVVRNNPLASRAYPGLFERRFAYEVRGTMLDLMRFFRAIEGSEYWADVSYFKIDQGQGSARSARTEPAAVLAISLFSAHPPHMERERG